MDRTPPPLLGFNNNVRHRGRVFHIQTEDGGWDNPRIETTVFVDGAILASDRQSYAHRKGRDLNLGEIRSLMVKQHQAMIRQVKSGCFDVMGGELGRPAVESLPE